MKQLILMLALICGTAFVSHGQKYAYIDSEYVLDNMPAYHDAKDELDKYAERWQKEIEERYKQIQDRKDEFLRVEAILPDEERK